MNLDKFRPKTLPSQWLLMLLIIAAAFLLRWIILPIDGRVIFSTFYPAVAIITLLCGYRIGFVGLLLGSILAYLYFIPPFHGLKPLDTEQVIGFATYFIAASIICFSFSQYFTGVGLRFLKLDSIGEKTFFMLLMITFAFLLRITALPLESRVIYSTFYPAVAVITLACGFRYGLISTLIGGLFAYLFLFKPFFMFKPLNLEQTIGLLTYFIAAGIICFSLREVILRGQKLNLVNQRLQDLMTTHSIGKTLEELVQVIASTIEMRDRYTSGHQRRVAELGVAIGTKMGLPERNLIGIKLAGLIHDLGKMQIPIEILTKPGQLSDAEKMLISEHPSYGYEALKDLHAPWPLADIVHQHHERMDGTGYPKQLKGDEILIEARILAVADVVEAMTAMRPYREGLGTKPALDEIKKHAGTKYDPKVVDTCVSLIESGEFHWN